MTKEDELKSWMRFFLSLEAMHDTASDLARRRFISEFQSELVLVAYWLNRLRVTGTELTVAPDPPGVCDLCGVNLNQNGLFIDGQIKDGRSSFMCMPCATEHGTGIGWGIGQLYRIDNRVDGGEPRWLCIAGGNPDPEVDAKDLTT